MLATEPHEIVADMVNVYMVVDLYVLIMTLEPSN